MNNQAHKNANGGGRRESRKQKRMVEKDLMNEYNAEAPESVKDQKSVYENMQYLSQREKYEFEDKFTHPKTRSQEIYISMLR